MAKISWKWATLSRANLEMPSCWIRKDMYTKPIARIKLVEKHTGFVEIMGTKVQKYLIAAQPEPLLMDFMSKSGR